MNQALLLRNEYLAAKNRILKAQIKGRLFTLSRRKNHIGPSNRASVAIKWITRTARFRIEE